MTNKEWALRCAARGWKVFPSEGKMPKVKWSTEATDDPSRITAWWAQWPDADVCIKTGAESDLVVVDWDAYKQDDPQWPLGPSEPDTYTARTAKGGYHFYFTHPGYPVANSAGKLAPCVDVRGDGGMVVAYPSVLELPLRVLPDEWATKRNTVTQQVQPIAEPYNGECDGLTLAVSNLEHYYQRVIQAGEGERNLTLWRMTADAFKMVAAGELREQTVINLMMLAGKNAGLDPDEVYKTVLSARDRGMLEPTGCVDMYWKERGRA